MLPSMLDIMAERFAHAGQKIALATDHSAFTYDELQQSIQAWEDRLASEDISAGKVVLLRGDFTPGGIGALFALMRAGAITILLSPSSFEKQQEFAKVGEAQMCVDAIDGTITPQQYNGEHPLYKELIARGEPGIVLFSSGSTGVSKGTVHSAAKLLEKFRAGGKDFRTLAFLLFDHIAGLDTLFYSLANESTLVLPKSRTPEDVCRLISEQRVEVLPTSPSFLNLLLLSGAHKRHDLNSLKIITYGSEMMSEATLERCSAAFPDVRLIQKYGASETGALPTQSRSNTSTWLKLGGEGFEWRVRDGLFEIRAKTAMLGYLNAPSPFTDDGFFMTGDRVEIDGEYVRFLGRDCDIINVGGQKVFPAEVENLLQQVPGVKEAAVYGEPHAILGSAVIAKIHPTSNEPKAELRKRIRAALSGKLEGYKIPQKFVFTEEALTTERFKVIRRTSS